MLEQWIELKKTIIEMRDNNGTGTQQEVCEFLVNLMNRLEKQEQAPTLDYKAFAEWVAEEIFDGMWDYNEDSFAEIACRKLEKLGLVKSIGTEWVRVGQEK